MAAGTKSAEGDSLSLLTLIVAALASAAAAVLVSLFSESGSAMAAALMAIFVPLLREAFHRPARVISDKRSGWRTGSSVAAAAGAGGAAVTEGRSAAEPRSAEPQTVAATAQSWGPEPAAAGPADPETRRLETDSPERDLETQSLADGAGGDAETRRVETENSATAAPTDRLDSDDDLADLETRTLGGATRPLDPETRGAPGGAAAARARRPARGGASS
ncbi:MAG: hypothetical protein AVDCRST_MAG45-2251, partial [uncultured Solirubrobacterales bacterium]